MGKQRGMTFIEILILVALLSIMLYLVFPAVMTVRAKGRKAQCMSNLRQVSVAMELYSHSYEGRLPPWLNRRHDAFGKTTAWDNPELLYQALRRGVCDSAVVYCPNDPVMGEDKDRFGINHRYFSYYLALRPEVKGSHLTMEGVFVGSRQRISPADYVLIRDANMMFVRKVPGRPIRGCEHLGGVNAIYLDGHAAWIR